MNSFVFNNTHYLQIHATAMGTHMAPTYANYFRRKSEREFLETQNKLPRVWWRYIDDIFTICTHGEPTLPTFIDNLNCHHPSIKFTASWSAKEVTFLDTRVYLKDGRFGTDLHVKRMDRHQFLCINSCHLKHCKTGIPYSQVLHL